MIQLRGLCAFDLSIFDKGRDKFSIKGNTHKLIRNTKRSEEHFLSAIFDRSSGSKKKKKKKRKEKKERKKNKRVLSASLYASQNVGKR